MATAAIPNTMDVPVKWHLAVFEMARPNASDDTIFKNSQRTIVYSNTAAPAIIHTFCYIVMANYTINNNNTNNTLRKFSKRNLEVRRFFELSKVIRYGKK